MSRYTIEGGYQAYLGGRKETEGGTIMSIKSRIIRGVLRWLWVKYPFQFKDIMLADKMHIHKNPRKRATVLEDCQLEYPRKKVK